MSEQAKPSKMRHAGLPLDERIDEAIRRITSGDAAMRIPVEATDPDVVLCDCRKEIHALRARIETDAEVLDAERDNLR